MTSAAKPHFDDFSDEDDSSSVSSTDSEELLARQREPDDNPLWINITHDKGIRKLVLEEGWGKPCPDGGDVYIKYKSKFSQTQQVFEDITKNKFPFKFLLGHYRVIRAWDIAVANMKIGEKALIRSTSRYAYGEKGEGRKIPPNTNCDFEIEIIDWQDWKRVDNKDGVRKRILKQGEGDLYDVPDNSSICDITYTAQIFEEKYPEEVFSRGRHVSVCVNDDLSFPEGFHFGLKSMNKYEFAEFKINPEFGFGTEGKKSLNIPPNAFIYYRVHMHNYQNLMSRWKMEPEQLFEVAKRFKKQGEMYFKAGDLDYAFERYEKSMHYWEADEKYSEEQKRFTKGEIALIRNNLALIHLKRKEYKDCVRECTKVLKFWPKNVKAFARRGHARMMCCNYKTAKKNIKKALSIDPSNAYAKKLLRMNRSKKKYYFMRQRELYGGMFDRYNEAMKVLKDQKMENKKMSSSLMGKLGVSIDENSCIADEDLKNEPVVGNDDESDVGSDDYISGIDDIETDYDESTAGYISFDDLTDEEVEVHVDQTQVNVDDILRSENVNVNVGGSDEVSENSDDDADDEEEEENDD